MKQLIFLMLLFIPMCTCAQVLPDYESNNYQAIVEWQKQPDGFCNEGISIPTLRTSSILMIVNHSKNE